jgi:dolichyl-phosphate-mannose-protein mannosyltransferase
MAPMSVVELAGSRLDDWWTEASRRPAVRRAWTWGVPAAVTGVAALTRLVGLGSPGELVFDETYYVKDAVTLMNLGYEGSWGPDADAAFNAGIVDAYDVAPSFVAHPPIGKWIIAGGLALLGAENPVGWRLGIAVAGILLVVATMVLAHLLFRSTALTGIAGGLIAIDGNAIVMSRVALLDTALALLCLVGVIFVVLDRRWARARLDAWLAARTAAGRPTDWGPVLWWRPWLLAAAVAFGLATGVKWSGLYFLAVFAVYSLVSDALRRRRAGVAFWLSGTALRQGPASFLLVVPLAALVYLASWAGWFATDGGYYRSWVEDGNPAWSGALAWVPLDLQNWWHYQATMYGYHVTERTPHPYQASPLGWLLLLRPTSMYYDADLGGGQSAMILDVANPLIWWAGTAALVALVVIVVLRLIRRRPVAREALILTGLAAGYLPWMLYLGRTVFQFYTIAFEPYLVLALTAVIGMLLGSAADPEPRRVAGQRVVAGFLAVSVALSIFFLPVWTGAPIPDWYLRLHFWFPAWV